jgi:hypothetical protein
MGLEKVEPLSTILIKAGAKRVLKDLVSNSTNMCLYLGCEFQHLELTAVCVMFIMICSSYFQFVTILTSVCFNLLFR